MQSALSMQMLKLILPHLLIMKSPPGILATQELSLLRIKISRRKADHLEDKELESMKKNRILQGKPHKQLKKMNMIQGNTESTEELGRILTIGQGKVLKSECQWDPKNDKV